VSLLESVAPLGFAGALLVKTGIPNLILALIKVGPLAFKKKYLELLI
jgi:hypothetical protein